VVGLILTVTAPDTLNSAEYIYPELTIEQIILNLTDDPLMVEIARAESNLNPKAENPTSSASGLFQILNGTWKYFDCEGDKFDVYDNTKCAIKIAEDSLEHWSESGNW